MSKFVPATTNDAAGRYGDGTFGHQHTRERCAETLAYYTNENFVSRGLAVPMAGYANTAQVVKWLLGEMSDDGSEEDLACDWLNKHAPFTGACWGWCDGDFGLWLDDDIDE